MMLLSTVLIIRAIPQLRHSYQKKYVLKEEKIYAYTGSFYLFIYFSSEDLLI